MSAVRNFTLINSEGEQFSLLDLDHFGTSPEGLGVEFDTTYFASYGSFIKENDSVKQNVLKFQVALGYTTKLPYTSFDHMIQVLNHPPLTLQYFIPFVGTFSRDIDTASINKTEMSNTYNIMLSEISLNATSPWYEWLNLGTYAHIPLAPEWNKWEWAASDTEHSATYPYVYQETPDTIQDYLDITNDSVYLGFQLDSPLRVEMVADDSTGVITNPGWELYDDAGFIVQKERLITDIPVGYKLVVNTDYKDRKMALVDPQGVETDISNSIDPTVKGFVRVPIGHYRLVLDENTQNQYNGFGSGRISAYLKKERLVV